MTNFHILFLATVLLALHPIRAQAAESPLPAWAMGPFVKQDKPVLSPTSDSTFDCPIEKKSVRWEQQNVYNPAAAVRDGKVYLLYRADDGPKPTAWGRTCRIGLAWSDDGRHFTRLGKPVLYPDEDSCKPHEWEGGCEDLHIIEGDDGTYYMNYTAWTGQRDSIPAVPGSWARRCSTAAMGRLSFASRTAPCCIPNSTGS